MIYRLPVDALLVAALARLASQVPDFLFFTMAPQGQARPYGQVARVVADRQSDKDTQTWNTQLDLEVFGIHPTMVDATSALSRAMGALTGSVELVLGDNWRVEWSMPIGSVVFQKVVDSVTNEVFWLGTQSLRFRVTDMLTHGA